MDRVEFTVTKKDFEVSWFSGTGAGGQHRNRHMNCCRIKHKATGIIKTGQSSRTRQSNQAEALNAIAKDVRFKAYCQQQLINLEVKARNGKTIEEVVEEMMNPENLKIETKKNGKWIDEQQ